MKLFLLALLLLAPMGHGQQLGEIFAWIRERLWGSTQFLTERTSPVGFRLGMETGLLLPVENRVQFGRDGTEFEYVEEGGQDLVFPFARYEAEIGFVERHKFLLLYQPLELTTRVSLSRDIRVDGLDFPENTPVELLYGFPYYRLTYLFDFLRSPRSELALGLSLQLRRAQIEFTSLDGELFRSRRNVGPVPLLNFRFLAPLPKRLWLAGDLQGLYAPGEIIPSQDGDGVGAFLGAGLKLGVELRPFFRPFFGIRYIGGGSRAEDPDYQGPGDGFAENWIHYLAFNLGFTFQ